MFKNRKTVDNNLVTECEIKEATTVKKEKFIADVMDLLDVVKWAAIAGILTFIVTRFFFPIAYIPTGSMENTIPSNSVVICSKPDYWFSEPERGDAVIFHRNDETGDENIYAKRIVGEPGDTVLILDGVTYVNGAVYEEPWLKEIPAAENFGPFLVPEGRYFLMGDNRNNSHDCRYWEEHFVDGEQIMAKIKVVATSGWFHLIPDGDDVR